MSITKQEIKRNLLGALDVALFMPGFERKFGDGSQEALRSFFVPILAFPVVLASLFLFTSPSVIEEAGSNLSLLYSLRYAVAVGFFLALVHMLSRKLDRHQYFNQFIIAHNWTAVPITIFLLPLLFMIAAGYYTAQELLPVFVCVAVYGLALTAYIAMRVFRIPFELGVFFAFLSLWIDKGTFDFMAWMVPVISG